MASVLEDLDVQGNLTCNNATVRGTLTVAGLPVVGGIAIANGGVAIAGNPHNTISFRGAATASDSGGGIALVAVGTTVQDDGVALPNSPYKQFNFIGNGVRATDGAPGGNCDVTIPVAAVLTFGAIDIGAPPGVRYLAPGTVAAATATEDFALAIPFQQATLLRNLYARHNRADGDGDPVDYVVCVNGLATALQVTLVTGAIGQASELVTTIAIAAGDTVSIQAKTALDITAGTVSVIVTLEVA